MVSPATISGISVEAGGSIFGADQVVGKSLIAKQKLTVLDNAGTHIGYVSAGQSCGVVYSWLDPKPGLRNALWWVFQGDWGGYYYIEHKSGAFDINALKLQGAVSLEDQYRQTLDENRGWLAKALGLPNSTDASAMVQKLVITGVVAFGIIYLGREVIKKKL